jgi:hypothetical protein
LVEAARLCTTGRSRARPAAESEENAHYSGIGVVIVGHRMTDFGIGPTYAVLAAADEVDR